MRLKGTLIYALTMPPELRKAHEAEIVAYLMQEYQRLVSEKK